MAGELANARAMALSRLESTLAAVHRQTTRWADGPHVLTARPVAAASVHVPSSVVRSTVLEYALAAPRSRRQSSVPAG